MRSEPIEADFEVLYCKFTVLNFVNIFCYTLVNMSKNIAQKLEHFKLNNLNLSCKNKIEFYSEEVEADLINSNEHVVGY